MVFADIPAVRLAGRRLPLVAQLFQDLCAEDGVAAQPQPLTIEEGRQQILQWIAAKKGTGPFVRSGKMDLSPFLPPGGGLSQGEPT